MIEGAFNAWAVYNTAPVVGVVSLYKFAEENISAALDGKQSWAQAYMNWNTMASMMTLEMLASPITITMDVLSEGQATIDAANSGDGEGVGKHGFNTAAGIAELATMMIGSAKFITCHSFAPTTGVLLANGTSKPIADVAVGDLVLATDPETGETSSKEVTQLHLNEDWDLAEVDIFNEITSETTTLETTWHHPFWNATDQRWTDAGDLTPGTYLRDNEGSETQRVVAVRTWTGLRHMRDLTVADIHTYYVLAGNTPVLVHNCGEGITVYRGVGSDHPGYANAENGIAVPRGGNSTAEMHQLGHTDSIWTSWTTMPSRAKFYALRTSPNGVVIEATIPRGRPHIHVNDQPWAVAALRAENEILIEGAMQGTPYGVTR